MPGRRRRTLLSALRGACLALLLTGQSLPAFAQSEDEEETLEKLQQLESDIARINKEISSATSRHDKLQNQLREAELELGKLQREIKENRAALDAGEKELQSLEAQSAEMEQARDKQQARIARELKTAWQMGRQGQIKVLLNQEDPHLVARSLAYYRYFFEARNELVEQYRQTLRDIQEVQERIDATLAELNARGKALEQQQVKLSSAQDARRVAAKELAARIDSQSAQLKQKQADRKQLEQLLDAIEEAVVDLVAPADYQPFKSVKGKMPWPLSGKPSNRFNRPRNQGKMRWQGLSIPAEEGTTVKAIHQGRVVYADWLRGSGLLLIIDHGDGYMSLYAHNESLLREVGEWVSVGSPISTVGSSGGADESALYFEVRHQGKPVDPAKWCST